MKNFIFKSPTQIVFGRGTIAKLNELINQDEQILLTYGGGSIFKNGVYDQVKTALGDRKVVEFGGIEVNPTYETLMKAAEVVRSENIGFGSCQKRTGYISIGCGWRFGVGWNQIHRRSHSLRR